MIGGTSSGWNDATNDSYPDWVEVAFNGAQPISEIDVFTRDENNPNAPIDLATTFSDGGITDFLVQYWDGASWVTVSGGNVAGNNKIWRQFTFAPVTTTRIRVTVNNALNASIYKYSRITEIEAWSGVNAPTNYAAYYIYADQINTPRVILRPQDNQMVWRWDGADPFGSSTPNENPSALGAFTYNARFPGQLFDKETNNFYNYFRDYDPGLGRYVQSDLIGLAGGS